MGAEVEVTDGGSEAEGAVEEEGEEEALETAGAGE